VTGSEGTIILENDRIVSAHLRASPELSFEQATTDDERSVSPVISDPRGHKILIEDFLQSIATGRAPLCDGREARRAVALVEAVYRSSGTGQAVSLA
jgi:predicted dehydrogenase